MRRHASSLLGHPPLSLILVGLTCGLLTLAPSFGAVGHSIILTRGDWFSPHAPAPSSWAWSFLRHATLLAAAAAPLAALRWPRVAVLLALGLLVPAHLTGTGYHVVNGSLISLVGVAACTSLIRPRLGAIIAVLPIALTLPIVLPTTKHLWVVNGRGAVSDAVWSPGHRLFLLGVETIAVLLALGSAVAVRLLRERHLERRAVIVSTAEIDTRSAIARDLHDVVAHRISLVAVRAETAPYQHPGLSDDARRILSDVATEARHALDEMREVLGVLDRGEHRPEMHPQPRVGDVPTLVEQARAAGSPVELQGAFPLMGEVLGNTVYRVVQEALTNARRHAPNQKATVAFSDVDEAITLCITNPCEREAGSVEMGRGLTGMRKRVELSGGMFHVKHEEGEFAVEARWPRGATARD